MRDACYILSALHVDFAEVPLLDMFEKPEPHP